jgi:Domain of unknown function (DUF5615)
MAVKFLIDENSWRKALVGGLKRVRPEIDVVHIGEAGAPSNEAKDPEILLYCEREQRLLVTRDRASMPVHARDHLRAGHHHWGIFYLRSHYSIGDYLDYLELVWAASMPEEYRDQEHYIPPGK